MRIISGKFRGRNLANSRNVDNLRPTTDKNRQIIFNVLTSQKFINNSNLNLTKIKVADLCCGTGALAFEAISRFAIYAKLVDISRKNLQLAMENAKILKCENICSFVAADIVKVVNNDFFDLIFLDPPYDYNYINALKSLIINNWFSNKTILVIEISRFNSDFIAIENQKYLVNSRIFKNNIDFIQKETLLNLNNALKDELLQQKLAITIIDSKLNDKSLVLFIQFEAIIDLYQINKNP